MNLIEKIRIICRLKRQQDILFGVKLRKKYTYTQKSDNLCPNKNYKKMQ